MPRVGRLTIFANHSVVILRMHCLLKVVLLFSLLTVVYQYSHCTRIPFFQGNNRRQQSPLTQVRRSLEKRLAPFNAIVGVASSNVPAYSNGNDTFYSNESHFLSGVYMGLKWQCVEYARRWTYIRRGAIFESVQGAKDMWTQLKDVQRVKDQRRFPLTRVENGSPQPPSSNSYLIYPEQKEMPYGHVAVIVDVLPTTIRIAEQNFNFDYWMKDYAREIPLVKRDGRYFIEDQYQVYGWMIIADRPTPRTDDDDDKSKEDLNQKNIQINSSSSSSPSSHFALLLLLLFVLLLSPQ